MIHIYTDGACSGNPGPGGWACIIVENEMCIKEYTGNMSATTNNRMEMCAFVCALEQLQNMPGTIVTDSEYVLNGIRKEWLIKWKQNGWCTAKKKPVANRDLWERIDALYQPKLHQLTWTRGHADNQWNNRADQLAVAASRKA